MHACSAFSKASSAASRFFSILSLSKWRSFLDSRFKKNAVDTGHWGKLNCCTSPLLYQAKESNFNPYSEALCMCILKTKTSARQDNWVLMALYIKLLCWMHQADMHKTKKTRQSQVVLHSIPLWAPIVAGKLGCKFTGRTTGCTEGTIWLRRANVLETLTQKKEITCWFRMGPARSDALF